MAEPAGGSIGRRFPRAAIGGATVLIVLALYVGASFARPTTVPRLTVFPRPAADRSYDKPCSEGGGHISEGWERSGLIWTRWRFTYGGCIAIEPDA